MRPLKFLLIVLALALAACVPSAPDPTATPLPVPTSLPAPPSLPMPQPGPPPAALPLSAAINLGAPTQALIAHAKRTIFLIPFSHWDTEIPPHSRSSWPIPIFPTSILTSLGC